MTVLFREAIEADIADIVALLGDDVLGQTREAQTLDIYVEAFRDMAGEPGNNQIVGEFDGTVIATYQLTLISGVSLSASRRAQIEGIRVASALRGQGIGQSLLRDAEARALAAGATLLQFTTNKVRDRAHNFYRREGFADTHLGFKKPLR